MENENSKTQTSPAYSMMYGYDSRNRLTSDSVWGSYAYDANSNRLSYLGSLGPLSYGYGTTSNQLNLFNGSAVTMDASGNILSLSKSGMSFTYDDWNRMRSATVGSTVTSYGVNGLGERVSKAQGTQKAYYIYSGVGQLLGVYDTSGNTIEEYVYLGSRPVASLRNTNDIYPVETDETMTPVRVLDSSNNVVWSWEGKEAFGLSAPTETMVNGSLFKFYLRFSGQYVDEETGLFQNGYRDYDPTTGRYMEADPLGLKAGMNDYGYVEDNPLDEVDSSGLRPVIVAIWLFKFPSVGHVFVGEMNGKVILSQFPNVHAMKGTNKTLTWNQTLANEGRQPSAVYEINVIDDNGFDEEDKRNRELPVWYWMPHEYTGNDTNCTVSAQEAFEQGDVGIPRPISPLMTPNTFNDALNSMIQARNPDIQRLNHVPW